MAHPIPAEMTVVEISASGGPEVLRTGRRAVPSPGPGQLLVRVAAAGVNGPDLWQRQGLYPPPPGASDLPGLEVAGEIVGKPDAETAWSLGDKVCALTNGGGYAQYCLVEASQCLPIPAGFGFAEAAGIPETFFAVWSNLFMGAGLKVGETVLIHGAAGGIGTTAIQLSKAFGARVFATDSPAERCAVCKKLGADRVIDYREEDFVEVVRSEGKGADVILDVVGGPYIERNIKAAAPDARIVQIAFALGSKVEINLMPVMLKRLTYTGSTLRSRSPEFKAEVARQLREQVWPLMEQGKLRPEVCNILPLEQASEAHRLMEAAAHTGKIILEVAA